MTKNDTGKVRHAPWDVSIASFLTDYPFLNCYNGKEPVLDYSKRDLKTKHMRTNIELDGIRKTSNEIDSGVISSKIIYWYYQEGKRRRMGIPS